MTAAWSAYLERRQKWVLQAGKAGGKGRPKAEESWWEMRTASVSAKAKSAWKRAELSWPQLSWAGLNCAEGGCAEHELC